MFVNEKNTDTQNGCYNSLHVGMAVNKHFKVELTVDLL